MIANPDSMAMVVVFGIGFLIICVAITTKRKRSSESGGSKFTVDAQTAVDTLMQYGYAEEEAYDLIDKALTQAPRGNCQTLINIAIKL